MPAGPDVPASERERLASWARRRPWLGGGLAVLGGLAIIVLPAEGFVVLLLPGLAGYSGFVIGGLIVTCGAFLLSSPQLHAVLGVACVLLSLSSFVTTNLGGFVAGMLLGILGGSFGFAWRPPDDG